MSDSEWSAFLSDVGKACESWPHGKYQIPRWIQLIICTVFVLAWAAYVIQNYGDLAAYLPWLEGTQPLLTRIMGGLTGVYCLIQVVHASVYIMDLKELRQVMTRIVDDHKDAMRAKKYGVPMGERAAAEHEKRRKATDALKEHQKRSFILS